MNAVFITIFITALLALYVTGPTPGARRWRARVRSGLTLRDPISGTAILVSLAISAASTAASYAAQRLLTPKPSPVDRGKVDDIRIQGSEYGSMIPRVIGLARLAGNILWTSGIRTTVTVTRGRSGGKGGPRQPDQRNYSYSTSLMIGVCEGPIQDIRRVWADDDVIIRNTSAGSVSARYEAEAGARSGCSVVSDARYSSGQAVGAFAAGATLAFTVTPYAGAGDYEISIFYYTPASQLASQTVTLSTSGGHTQDRELVATGGNVATVTLNAPLLAGANTVTIATADAATFEIDKIDVHRARALTDVDREEDLTGWHDGTLGNRLGRDVNPYPHQWWNDRPSRSVAGVQSGSIQAGFGAGVRLYNGTTTQGVDSAIEAALGVGNAPAYREWACVMFEDFQLKDGRVPNFTFEVSEGTDALDQAVTKLYSLAGVGASDLEVSDLSGLTFTGLLMERREPLRSTLEQLQIAYSFDLAEVDGKIRATRRGGAPLYTIPYTDLRAHDEGEQTPEHDLIITRREEHGLPRRVDVNYLDPALDYHTSTQSASRYAGNFVEVVTLNLSIVMTADQAKTVAEAYLAAAHLEATLFEFNVGPKYLKAAPNDVIKVADRYGVEHSLRINDQQFSMTGGAVKISGAATDASIYNASFVGAPADGRERRRTPPPAAARLEIMDLPLLRLEDDGLGTYRGLAPYGPGDFPAGVTYAEEGGEYEFETTHEAAAVMGDTATALEPPAAGGPEVDEFSSVDVNLLGDQDLESITREELLSTTRNLALVGDEIIQFQTATPAAAAAPYKRRYTLGGGLLRNRLGTDAHFGPLASEALRWETFTGTAVEASNGVVSKASGAAGWDAGARSVQSFLVIEAVAVATVAPTATATDRMIGLSLEESPAAGAFAPLQYAIYFDNSNAAQIYERGVSVHSAGAFTPGQAWEIRVSRSGLVEYTRAGVVIYTSKALARGEQRYRVEIVCHTAGATVEPARLTRAAVDDTRALESVAWASIVGAYLNSRGGLTPASSDALWGHRALGAEDLLGRPCLLATSALTGGASAFFFGLTAHDSAGFASYLNSAYAIYYSAGTVYAYEEGAVAATIASGVAAETALEIELSPDGSVRYLVGSVMKRVAPRPWTKYPRLYAFADVYGASPAPDSAPLYTAPRGHRAGERFLLLDGAVKFRHAMPEDLGVPRLFKGLAVGADLDQAPAVPFLLRGNSARPFAPGLYGGRNSAGDLLIAMTPRTRLAPGWREGQGARLQDPDLAGAVEIVGPDHQNIVRTLPVSPDAHTRGLPYYEIGKLTDSAELAPTISGSDVVLGATYPAQYHGFALSLATLTEARAFVEADLDFDTGGVALGLRYATGQAPLAYSAFLDSATPPHADLEYAVAAFYVAGLTEWRFYERGVLKGTVTLSAADSGRRYRLEVTTYGVEFRRADSPVPIFTFRSKPRLPLQPVFMLAAKPAAGTTTTAITSIATGGGYALSTVYTAGDQATDFGGLRNPCRVRAYQISPLVGRGFVTERQL